MATIQRDDLRMAIEEAFNNADLRGQNWHYVRVWPNGTFTVGEEVSPCYPESEYYGRKDENGLAPVTVYAVQSSGSVSVSDGLRTWEPCEEAEAEFWTDDNLENYAMEKDETHQHPHKLGDWIDLDVSDSLEAAIERLEAAGYTVED